MTEYAKLIILTQIALAILVLPSSGVCNCSGEDIDNCLASCEFLPWYECSNLSGKDDLDEYEGDGAGFGNRPGFPWLLPVAYDSTVTVRENTPVEITLSAKDPDGNTMTYSICSRPSGGTLGTIAGNTVVYTPHANFTGTDSFSFRAHDVGTRSSNPATVTITVEPDCPPRLPHVFYGTVTIEGEPVPGNTTIGVTGRGVRQNCSGNPVTTRTDGLYGSADDTDENLVVQGCIEDGAPLAFYVDGKRAEVCEVNTSSPWRSFYPFRSGDVTNLDIRLPSEVCIDAISATISNSTYGFSSTIELVKDPWLELRLTRGMFNVKISATGIHRFTRDPERGRDATLGIYENGTLVSSEKNVWFGSKEVRYQYMPMETRTFDILIYVNEKPEIRDVKHLTIYACSESDSHTIVATADHGGSITPAGYVLVDADADQGFDITPSYGYQITDVIVDG
jgi:hypothetical protein